MTSDRHAATAAGTTTGARSSAYGDTDGLEACTAHLLIDRFRCCDHSLSGAACTAERCANRKLDGGSDHVGL